MKKQQQNKTPKKSWSCSCKQLRTGCQPHDTHRNKQNRPQTRSSAGTQGKRHRKDT